MKKIYKKLIRDKLPDIIRAQGNTPCYRVLEKEEYRHSLMEKLREETGEFEENSCLEELCDILEVIKAIAKEYGFTGEEIAAAMNEKAKRNGGFEQRIFLEDIVFHE